MKMLFIDVRKAHLNGICEEEVFVELPESMTEFLFNASIHNIDIFNTPFLIQQAGQKQRGETLSLLPPECEHVENDQADNRNKYVEDRVQPQDVDVHVPIVQSKSTSYTKWRVRKYIRIGFLETPHSYSGF